MVQKKILLAEDDIDDQRFFKEFLHDRRDIILMPIAENGDELLRFLEVNTGREHHPDLIILDQNMPKRNGIQTLQFLKSEKRFTNIPIVIYSTYADPYLAKDAFKMGAFKVLTKPVTKEGYHRMMDDLLSSIG